VTQFTLGVYAFSCFVILLQFLNTVHIYTSFSDNVLHTLHKPSHHCPKFMCYTVKMQSYMTFINCDICVHMNIVSLYVTVSN